MWQWKGEKKNRIDFGKVIYFCFKWMAGNGVSLTASCEQAEKLIDYLH